MTNYAWLYCALASAAFAALTAIFGKVGVEGINSNLATFIRTVVILILIAGIVTLRGEWNHIERVQYKGLMMLIASGVATGLSWLFYYRALQLGDASRVAPIDKLSIVLVILFAVIFLGETLTWKVMAGGVLIAVGAVLLALP